MNAYPKASPQDSLDFLKTEYTALRGEMLKRVEIQHQLISLGLLASGTFISVGLQISPTVTFAYPILGLFLIVAWTQSDIRIRQMGMYIRKRIEPHFLDEGQGWEQAKAQVHGSIGRLGSLSLLASRGILVGTQLLTLLISLLRTDFPPEDATLLAIDILVIAVSIFMSKRPEIVLPDKDSDP